MSKHVSLNELDDANPAEVYNRVLPDALRLPSNRVRSINVDVDKVISFAMAGAKRLQAFEADLRALQGFPVEQFDSLADYTLALYSAHLRYKFLTRPTEQLPALNKAATRWRAVLLADAKSLIERQLIKAERLKPLAGHHGYRNIANDLAGLAQIFKSEWEHIQSHTWLKPSDIEAVSQLALKLTGAIADRTQPSAQLEAAIDVQARMFTLLYDAYDEIRRGMHNLRWHYRDADDIVPSFYSRVWKSKAREPSQSRQLKLAPTLAANPNSAVTRPEEAIARGPSAAALLDISAGPIELPVAGPWGKQATPACLPERPAAGAASSSRKIAARRRRTRAANWRRGCEQTAFRASVSVATSDKRPAMYWERERALPDRNTEHEAACVPSGVTLMNHTEARSGGVVPEDLIGSKRTVGAITDTERTTAKVTCEDHAATTTQRWCASEA
ncbi:MAG: hypothetical protein QM784_02010 [Polyangiaceae bacterium]